METTSPFILVHDIWHSGVHWQAVCDRLTAAGHTAHRPTLTGHGIDGHPDATIDDEITSIIDAIGGHDEPVNLVAHGWSGAVASAAAARIPDRIRQVTYVSAILPEDGPRCLWDELPTHMRDIVERCLDPAGRLAPPPVDTWQEHWVGWAPLRQVEWWHATLTPIPAAALTTRIDLTDWYALTRSDLVATTYIHLQDNRAYGATYRWHEYARSLGHPREIFLPGGHETMLTAPGVLTATLRAVADLPCRDPGGHRQAPLPTQRSDLAYLGLDNDAVAVTNSVWPTAAARSIAPFG